MSWRTVLVLLVALGFLGGCAPRGETVKPPVRSSAEVVKTTLEEVAKTGEVSSQVYGAKMELTNPQGMDKAKADALIKDFDDLLNVRGNPAQAKAKAAAMLKKL